MGFIVFLMVVIAITLLIGKLGILKTKYTVHEIKSKGDTYYYIKKTFLFNNTFVDRKDNYMWSSLKSYCYFGNKEDAISKASALFNGDDIVQEFV